MRSWLRSLALATVALHSLGSAQWVQTNGPGGFALYSFAVSDNNLFVGTNNRVHVTGNGGTTWAVASAGLPLSPVVALAVSGGELFASSNGVFRSTNNGASWTPANTPFTNFTSMVEIGSHLFAAAGTGGIYESTDGGTIWAQANSGLPPSSDVRAIAISDTILFAGTWTDGVFRSTDKGGSWNDMGAAATLRFVTALAVADTNIFVAIQGNLYRSSVSDTTWVSAKTGLPTTLIVNALVTFGKNIFAGTYDKGVYLTTNSGSTWQAVNEDLGYLSVNALAISGMDLFFGGNDAYAWKRPLSQMITSAGETSQRLPAEIKLYQNYPNPFNPSTTIRYELPKSSVVRLTVYDILGREVSVIVNEKRDAGSYEVTFDAARLSTGVYVYRIEAGDFAQSKSLIVLK